MLVRRGRGGGSSPPPSLPPPLLPHAANPSAAVTTAAEAASPMKNLCFISYLQKIFFRSKNRHKKSVPPTEDTLRWYPRLSSHKFSEKKVERKTGDTQCSVCAPFNLLFTCVTQSVYHETGKFTSIFADYPKNVLNTRKAFPKAIFSAIRPPNARSNAWSNFGTSAGLPI